MYIRIVFTVYIDIETKTNREKKNTNRESGVKGQGIKRKRTETKWDMGKTGKMEKDRKIESYEYEHIDRLGMRVLCK